MEPVRFVILGRPQVKQRPRVGNGRVIYTPPKTQIYEDFVRWTAKKHIKKPFEGPVFVTMLFYFKDRKNLGDLSNFVKAVEDGMNKVAYADDRQIRKLEAEMRFDQLERAEVEIRPYEVS